MKLFTYIRDLFFAPKQVVTPVIFSSSYCPDYNLVGINVLPTVEELAGMGDHMRLGDGGFSFDFGGQYFEVGEHEIFVDNVFVGSSYPYYDMVSDLFDLSLQEIVDLHKAEADSQRNI